MALGPWVLFLGLVVVSGGLPLYLATLRPSLRVNLLYGHLVVLQLLRGFLAVSFVMPLGSGLDMAPGNVMYAAIVMTSVLLVLVERRTAVLRTVILVLGGTEVIKLAAFAVTRWALGSPAFVNVVGIDPQVFGNTLWFSGIGSVLIVLEVVAMVVVLERVRRRIRQPRLLSFAAITVFCLVVLADGFLFPAVTQPFDPALSDLVAAGVARKAVLAAAFGGLLLAFVLLRPTPVQRDLTTSLRLRDVLFAPRHRLVERLEQQEQERVELLERALHVAEDERRRLAEDLHDDAIQLLTAADIRLQRQAASSPGLDIERIQDLLRSGVGSLRRLILELRGPDVTAASFAALVGAYVDRLIPNGDPEVALAVDLPEEVPDATVGGAYRIVLEALANAYKHAEATHVTVTVGLEDEVLVGRVVDDGVGIGEHVDTGLGHLGLRAMRDRADALHGRVDVRAADGGTVVSFELPVAPARRPADDQRRRGAH